jgi:hypothetical protein
MYAEVEIGRYVKVKKIRTAPLINSLPYYKAGIAQHPMPGNPNAYLFISYENSAKYRNAPLGSTSLLGIYSTYLRKHHFSKLLERPDVPPEDKIKVKQVMQKPWNPYIRRHTGLHEKARLLNENMLRQHAGWKKTSSMVEIYTRGLGDKSSEDVLLADGIDVKNIDNKDIKKQLNRHYSPYPHCSEPNKLTSKFCNNCQMVLAFDAFNETIKDAEESKKNVKR